MTALFGEDNPTSWNSRLQDVKGQAESQVRNVGAAAKEWVKSSEDCAQVGKRGCCGVWPKLRKARGGHRVHPGGERLGREGMGACERRQAWWQHARVKVCESTPRPGKEDTGACLQAQRARK